MIKLSYRLNLGVTILICAVITIKALFTVGQEYIAAFNTELWMDYPIFLLLLIGGSFLEYQSEIRKNTEHYQIKKNRNSLLKGLFFQIIIFYSIILLMTYIIIKL